MKSAAERTESGPDIAAPAGALHRQQQVPSVRRSAALMNPRSLAMLQRSAGNAAVAGIVGGRGGSRELPVQRDGNPAAGALIAAKLRSPEEQALTEIDAALAEIRRAEPAIDTVEKGLKAAKAAGVPVDLDGPKPPASALAVTKTGFGPGSVPAKKPVPPPKSVPAVHPLGKVGAKGAKPMGGKGAVPAGPAPVAAAGGSSAPMLGPTPLTKDKLLQPPAPPAGTNPAADPAFGQVAGGVKGFAKIKKAHPPASAKAKEAQDAALAPTDDLGGQAKAAKVDAMDAQPPGSFDKKAFIAAVKAAIEAKSPKTLSEADNYKESGKAGEVKGEVKGLVTQGKDGQAKDIEVATEAPPDPSKAVPKPVTPMQQEQPGQPVQIPAAGAVPKPAPAEQVNLEAGKQQANQEMADAEITEPQLAKSNEPEFEQGLADKKAAAAHADSAPGAFREQEKAVLTQGQSAAAAETTAGVTGMQGAKGAALAKLVADKGATKSKDETKRAEVTTKIQGIFAATETEVKKILDGLDPKVEKEFEQGEAGARSAFENYVATKMSAYKEDRYGGWLGGLRWAKDKLVGMPDKVNEFYEAGRELYLKQMDGVISRVADIVSADLTAAKQRIAKGKAEIATYVKTLPTDLQKVGSEASTEIGEKFTQLESDVDAKQEAVVDTLATKYVEARKGLDERIDALQAENKGLVDKAIGAIKGIINTIRELAAMLKNVLSRVAGVVGDIIKDPVGFLGNLIEGVKGGILKFKDNILTHLRNGLMSWLFGALAEGGIELPEKFDIKGIIKLLASIFGLTWANIRNRLVKQIGEKAMAAAEKGVEIFQIIAAEGVGGLWNMLIEKLGDIKEMILEQVKDFVITKIITAGITWLIGLLNPAAAFIKACKLIYDVVMFFVDNAARIVKFVNTIIDSVADIVRGNVSGVVDKINDVLGQMVPIIIGFLASVIGLGGIGEKIRQIIQTLQKPINKALDFVIKTGLKLAGPIIRGIKGISGKVKSKVAAGKAWVKGKAGAVKAKLLGGDNSPEGKQPRLEKGVKGGVAAANRFAGRSVGEKILKPVLSATRVRFGLSVLEPVKQGANWAVHGEVQRMTEPTKVTIGDDRIEDVRKLRESANNQWSKAKESLKPLTKKIKDTKNPLKPADLAAARKSESEFSAYEPGFLTKKNRFDEIRKKKEAPAGEIDALATFFTEAAEKFTGIRTNIEDATAATLSESDLQAQADPILKRGIGTLTSADAGLSDAGILQGLVIPSAEQPTPAEKVRTARDALKAALDACPAKVADAAQLRQIKDLEPLIGRCDKALGDARNEIKAVNQVKIQVDAVENVYTYTTNYGSFGDRTSEGAAKHEAKTGEQVGHSWHGGKCRDYERNLILIIKNLRQQRAALPAGVHGMLDAAIKRADERRERLKDGADTWEKRVTLYPAIWDDKGVRRT